LIPSEFLSIFPNNFGINLCAIKGFNIEMTEDKQYKSITIDFIPKIETTDKRISKEIIDYLKCFIPHHDDNLVTKSKVWIAWLEKQGELTRTDAFIEKAAEWLRKNADNYTWYDEFEGKSGMIDGFIEVFRSYMKEE
jgi:hypothetical protein